MGTLKFSVDTISNQKRLARGEQFLLARSILRERDGTHYRKWRVMTLAGGAPAGEVRALRELMPKCHITAIDIEAQCLSAAIDAGADDVMQQDITAWHLAPGYYGSGLWRAPAPIHALGRFDIVNLDLCGGANETTRVVTLRYMPLVTAGGVMVLTFSYGRDVIEVFNGALRRLRQSQNEVVNWLSRKIPDNVLGRVVYMVGTGSLDRIASVIVYRGNEMPMCSVLMTQRKPTKYLHDVSFSQLEEGDLECAAAFPDTASLYDYPQARIDAIRRKYAAFKATLTRQSRRANDGNLFHLNDDGV